jgi:predicted glycosyltransferase
VRYLFIVGHPAHAHLFRNVVRLLRKSGDVVLVGAVAREVTTQLLRAYGIPHVTFGKSRRELLAKGLDILPKDLALILEARRFDPDMIISTGSPYGAHVSAILAKPHVAFGDTEHATLVTNLMLPFTDAIFTPSSFKADLGPKHLRYNGSKELAYLHPRYFQPDPSVLAMADLSRGQRYVILRFAAWDSSHDIGDHGFGFKEADKAVSFVQELERFCQVLVTSDEAGPASLEDHRVVIPPERLHDLLAYATLYIGEGATMAAEAGILGVPWIFVSTTGRGFLDEQQHCYRLGFWEATGQGALERAKTLLADSAVSAVWKGRREALLREKVDVTQFMYELIKGWPDSLQQARDGRWGCTASSAVIAPRG